jgi:hypothetical protein
MEKSSWLMAGRFAVLAVAASVATDARGKGVDFPRTSSCVSPDLRWRVTCESENSSKGYLHSLYESRLHGTGRAPFYSFDRRCELLWSPGSDIVAVTDWEGSSTSAVFLIDLNAPERRQDIEDMVPSIAQRLGREEREGHVYWEALKWESPRVIVLRVFGHTDEEHGHAFCYTFRVNVSDCTCAQISKDASDHAEEAVSESKRPEV